MPCPQRVSYLQCIVVINGSDPVLVLVKQPSPLCSPVRAGRASFKLQRKEGKMSGLTDTRKRDNVCKTCIEYDEGLVMESLHLGLWLKQ